MSYEADAPSNTKSVSLCSCRYVAGYYEEISPSITLWTMDDLLSEKAIITILLVLRIVPTPIVIA